MAAAGIELVESAVVLVAWSGAGCVVATAAVEVLEPLPFAATSTSATTITRPTTPAPRRR